MITLPLILSLIFFAIAAVCNAVMDRLETLNQFGKSIWWKRNPHFWCKEVSWTNKYVNGVDGAHKKIVLFGWRTPFDIDPISDAWHIAKSSMIVLGALSATIAAKLHWWLHLPLLGLVWVLVFNLCYNKLFKRK